MASAILTACKASRQDLSLILPKFKEEESCVGGDGAEERIDRTVLCRNMMFSTTYYLAGLDGMMVNIMQLQKCNACWIVNNE